jgi:hypothetical protein
MACFEQAANGTGPALGGKMNCEEYKKLMAVQIFGQLTESEKEDLLSHIGRCTDCEARWHKSVQYKGLMENQEGEIPEPDWEVSWQAISGNLPRTRRHSLPFKSFKRWALAASVLLVVFVAGFLAGRKLLHKPEGPDPTADQEIVTLRTPSQWQQYADRLEPLLSGFTNRSRLNQPEELRILENKVIREMLIQTRLLKAMTRTNDMNHIRLLLEDLENILISMSNMRPEDWQSADYLSKIIKEKEIKFKVRTLIKNQRTI